MTLAADLDHILAHTQDLWKPLRGRSIFITGGTGFFGRWLLESFVYANDTLGLGAQAVVLTRNPERFAQRAPALAAHPALCFIKGDVTRLSHNAVLQQLPAGHDDVFPFIIHAATESGSTLGLDHPALMFNTVVDGTWRMLEFSGKVGAKRFLFTSSGAVYGRQPAELPNVPETYPGAPDPNDPLSAYGEGKRAAELLCALASQGSGLEPLIARCFAFVGPFLPLDVHFAAGNFMRDLMAGGPIRIGGDGSPYRSYLHAADLMIWLWTILFKGESNFPYNVGSPEAIDIEHLARLIAAQGRPPAEVILTKSRTPGAAPARYVPDVTRAAGKLGLRLHIPLEEAIRRTLAFHQSNV